MKLWIREGANWYSVNWAKKILKTMKMYLTLDDRVYRKKDEEEIAKANLIESLQRQAEENNP